MSIAGKMTEKLKTAFAPIEFELIDESELHRGHGGWREGGETHFRLRMISTAFEGQNRVQRQRSVNKILAEELTGPVHALSMELAAPES